MRKLLIGAALGALVATPVLADEPAKVTTEPVKLSLSQMDKLTAGRHRGDSCAFCANFNKTDQLAVAVAVGGGAFSFTEAFAANSNFTEQEIN